MPSADDLILAVDQGTGSTKSMLIDRSGQVVADASVAVDQTHPSPGWVEQDADQLWESVVQSVRACLADHDAGRVIGLALSVQRETVVLWERSTGRAVAPALSWQDQRTSARAQELEDEGQADEVRRITGLPLDPMFSALKASWLLDQHDPDRVRSRAGELCVGTIDAWLLSHFGDAAVTEIGNASRTQLLGIEHGGWDDALLAMFDVPREALPEIVSSTGPFPPVRGLDPLLDGIPVLAVLADSHAALFAHGGWRPGIVKATYGTGSSVMALGTQAAGATGVCSTIAWQVDGIAYALEANIRSTGRTFTWLAELFDCTVDTLMAEAAGSGSDDVVIVPAFGGLGAPWWDRDAVPIISRLSLRTTRSHVARAALESIAFQVDDALQHFADHVGPLHVLAADGGMTRSTALMQLQADISGLTVRTSATANLSALGAAQLAGMVASWWGWAELEAHDVTTANSVALEPRLDQAAREQRLHAWHTEIDRSRLTARRVAQMERTS